MILSFMERENASTVSLNMKIADYREADFYFRIFGTNKKVSSSRFTLEDGTAWYLDLYPLGLMGEKHKKKGSISVYLRLSVAGDDDNKCDSLKQLDSFSLVGGGKKTVPLSGVQADTLDTFCPDLPSWGLS